MSIKKLILPVLLVLLVSTAWGQKIEMLTGRYGPATVTKRIECIKCENISEDQQIELMEIVFRDIQMASDADALSWAVYLRTLMQVRGSMGFKSFLDDTNFWLREHYMQ